DDNVRTTQASSDNIPFDDESFDFVFSLGVLHHIPDTQQALNDIVKKVKKNGHVLIYLYYSLDNRSSLYKLIFQVSSLGRYAISRLPKRLKQFACDVIAVLIYLPLIFLARIFRVIIRDTEFYKKMPLSYYLGKSLRVIRNDALDRFGTPLEQRFSRDKIKVMMEKSGLKDIKISENTPYWHAIGKRTA
ncbi:MAG: class I SAM-dependent methyltransferase, partial [Bacteroidetes bacterium]|nr:class I SAM-dependent methyltransferase [Bacteroidota bacterium]